MKWRRKIGEEGCEWLLTQTLQACKKLGVLRTSSLDKVVMNTACMKKAIAHPVDSKLFNHMREILKFHLFAVRGSLRTDRVPKQVYVDGGYRAASGSTNRCEHHRAKAAQQSNEAMGEAAKQRGTHHRVPESRTQNARQLAQMPPGLHYDSGAGRERL